MITMDTHGRDVIDNLNNLGCNTV